MRGSRGLPASLIAALVIGALALAGCGDEGGQTTPTTGVTRADQVGDDGDGQANDGDGANAGDQGSQESDGSGDGSQGAGSEGSASGTESDFAASLRAIVGESLAELAPLAQGRAAAGAPEQYAQMLADAVPGLDDTISRLEDLEPPADAEEGTRMIIDSYEDLREAIARGAKDFSTGKPAKIESALVYLEQASADFQAGLAEVTQSLGSGSLGIAGG